MRNMVVPMVLLAALAGCADGSSGSEDTLGEDLGLEATSTTGVIRGVVVDETITPIAEAEVTITTLNRSTLTNADGVFGFSALEPGIYFLQASASGYNATQVSATVEAGQDRPPAVRVMLVAAPSEAALWIPYYFQGYLTCGAAIFATSVGCTTLPDVAALIGDQSVFPHDYETRPDWVQGELIWRSTQALSGAFIWEITLQGSNSHIGYRETVASPALNYLDTATLDEEEEDIMDRGINFRFFGGPHELCPGTGYPNSFGCGLTLEQSTEIFVHDFYNHVPPAGWRLTEHGDPPLPE